MKYNSKKILGVLAISIPMLFMTACGEIESPQTLDDAIENGGAYKESKLEESKGVKDIEGYEDKEDNKGYEGDLDDKETPSDSALLSSEPVVLSVNKTEVITNSFNESLLNLDRVVHENEGYIVSHEMKSPEEHSKNLDREVVMAIRVPRKNLDKTLDFISEEFYIKSESSNTVDITKDYHDIKSEVENLEKQENRLSELLEKTESLDDIIKIGDEITRINNEKKSLETSKIEMDYRINYSRINITIKEVDEVPSKNNEHMGTKERIKSSLLKTLTITKKYVINVFILIITSSPLAIVAVALYIIYRRYGQFIRDRVKDSEECSEEDEEQ